ncbi:hypothetical protein LTR56_018342 [Elasticomyces elasticus]|nr:hypothetical protein LTR22_022196 [Elasticomyces elasticus]KAK3628986.1 hypothetical protein LTR56_018342 [Elasticomyces elasticus]KAK4903601.1 hypothetical protein LTR49_026778 [Elasticomyces elasticus]KAK5736891.1 hypothetical protein LTS12_026043 [Elasticomyces elasticus]
MTCTSSSHQIPRDLILKATLNMQPSMNDVDDDPMEGIIYYGRGESAEHADSDTSERTTSRFLSMPRELRDVIYEYTTKDILFLGVERENNNEDSVSFSLRKMATPEVTIFHVANSGLLCANRQIHDEYVEQIQPRSTLLVELHCCLTPHLKALNIASMIPATILGRIKQVAVLFSCWSILDFDNGPQSSDWFRSGLTSRRDLPWTPAKGEDLLLEQSHNTAYVNPDARVEIRVDFANFPDPSDPYTWDGPDYLFWDHLYNAFHQDTIFQLAHDRSLAWPAAGNLKVCGHLKLPLWSPKASNSAEIMEGRKAWVAGAGVESLRRPKYDDWYGISPERIMVKFWRDANDWRDFEPEVTSYIYHECRRTDYSGRMAVTLLRY